MTTTNARTKWILLAAIAAVPVAGVTTPASAQYQNEQRGNALDANRRIGDDRSNDVGRSYRLDNRVEAVRQPTGNQIVTGNVTGNRQFRGNPGYSSEREFRGGTASDVSDNFIRSSGGTAGASNRITNYNVGVPFYPAGRTAQPPPGFVPMQSLGGGYVPSSTVDNRIDRGSITPRGGSTILTPAQPMGTLGSAQNQVITASPLLGVQQLPYNTQPGLYGQGILGQRGGTLDEATIERMRNELRSGSPSESGTGNPAGATSGTESPGALNTGVGTFDAQGRPIGQQTVGAQLTNPFPGAGAQDQQQRQQGQQPGGPIGAQNLSGATVGASNVTGQSSRQRMLPTPGEQTPAYAELRRKLQEYANNRNMTDEEAFRAAQRARQEADAAAKKAKPADGTTPATPTPAGTTPGPQQPQQKPQDPNAPPQTNAERLGLEDFSGRNEQLLKGGPIDRKVPSGTGLPGAVAPTTPRITAPAPQPGDRAAGGPKPAPMKIDTLAKGVPGKGLADLLTGAESLMKEGRFSSALEKYDAAEQVAPNNPLIKLGRANAELGASYFARAEQHLREAFAADEALLMGQYDLRAFFGEDRLKVIANDLKEIANKEQAQVTPVFLLAYVAYNSENERMAAGYLDLADKRSGGKDALIKKIREHWTLPAGEEVEGAPAEPAAPAKQGEPADLSPDIGRRDGGLNK